VDTIFKTLRVKATMVSVRLRIFSIRVNKYQQSSDQTDLKRQSRCDVEMCCNALREGEGGWPLGEADHPKGGGRPPLESSSVRVRSV
jgi:hypothetical protein